jgi:hypothetical protein
VSSDHFFCYLLLTAIASKADIRVQEVAVRPRARRSARFISRIPTMGSDTSICWLFQAKLTDGSLFAIDVCSAQYTINAPEDCDRGVFPWEQYMERLSVSHGDFVTERRLGFCILAQDYYPVTGTVENIKAGIFTAEDIQSVAEFLVKAVSESTIQVLPKNHNGLTLERLLRLPPSDYNKGVESFKTCHQQSLQARRCIIDHGDTQYLLANRYEAGSWDIPPEMLPGNLEGFVN